MNRNSSHDAPAKLLSRRKGAAPVSTTPKSTFSNQSAVFNSTGEAASFPSAAASTSTNGTNAPSAFGNPSWKPAASTTSASRPIGAAFAAAESSASSSAMPSYLFAPGAGDPDPPSSSPAPSIGQQGSGLGRFMRSRESPGPSTISGQRNALGGMVETDAERKKRFDKDTVGSAIRFQELKEQREAMRERYIRQGVLPDDTKAQNLAATQTLRGTCMEMCSEFERVEREVQKEADPPELYPGTEKIDPRLAVKIYRRPAAGRELPLPDDVRPPAVLRRTLDYLFHTLLPTDPSSTEFAQVQGFIWNRTRAVRQDFIVQGQGGPMTIECHERIARYHILCLHWKGGRGAEEWSEQQEMEQLRKTIRSLSEFYADLRALTGKSAPNEAEFRAYELLLHHRDPDTLREIERLPPIIFDSPTLQTALRLRGLAQGAGPDKPRDGSEGSLNLWTRFFAETKKARVPYLLACLAETIIPTVRAGALRAMSSAYMAQHPPLPVQDLTNDLSFDSQEEALEFARNRGIGEQWTTEESGKKTLAVRIDNKTERALVSDVQLERSKAVPFSQIVVESKRQRWSCRDIIDGVASGATPLLNHDGGQPLPAPFHPARQPSAAPSVPSRQSATPVTDHWNAPTSRKAALPPPVISRPVQPYSAPVAAPSAFDNSSSGSIWAPGNATSTTMGQSTKTASRKKKGKHAPR
ncbi:Nuclear protein export factor [Ceraceosorus bombacis]|uniref:Nuclear protein export factor n=1 Tax=Ceraceosorus bombacis TaxID=401625 RepID=A0A0P1BMJ0_9BASI|nr:Nuclear protein export factor [Ceraceosorus bombacis]